MADWPDEVDESSFLSDAASRGEVPLPVPDRSASPVIGDTLPTLEELVGRVPANVLGILDDLFRAKFTGVRRFAAGVKPEAAGPVGAPR